ncbi:MAG: 2-amino-4-hydroxy-6-hydroxymethyldihydropteridine diphosphokinase [Candidatus Fermentibacteraceae bacterium]|nr:2-amino-4-hydroxy-6-hydroxymethyldihydropteridine diphosphokinase [Candidatus Fermentibacteraceae bacterium]MBN2608032.1 2-amino-4-hydroxy-6-hydroxymethyldihydropteridine diphosphokinase [Candidatus Fermentibacteraceae bacterium]
MAEFALGMGSNLGNRIENLLEGVRFILSRPRMGRFRLSGVYETPPLEGVGGSDFYNCVLTGSFYGTADELLGNCRGAEVLMGSMVNKNNAPRTLDLDLLFFNDETRSDSRLTLPHPGIRRRRFVLQPLAEVWNRRIPGLGYTPSELLRKCKDSSSISLILKMPEQGCFWEVCS